MPRISDKAVLAATGRNWDQWFEALDGVGARTWNHAKIAKHVLDQFEVTAWWAQSVTVAYEQSRGLRDEHERPDGYQIQRQKRIRVSADTAWQAWKRENQRDQWLPDANRARPRSERSQKRVARLEWPDGTRVVLSVTELDSDKCAVSIQQSRLRDARSAEQAKDYWAGRLGALKSALEGP